MQLNRVNTGRVRVGGAGHAHRRADSRVLRHLAVEPEDLLRNREAGEVHSDNMAMVGAVNKLYSSREMLEMLDLLCHKILLLVLCHACPWHAQCSCRCIVPRPYVALFLPLSTGGRWMRG